MDALFSDEDRQRIAEAVETVEARSAAEIVPYVVVQSDDYPAARWRGGALGALLVLGLGALLRGLPLPLVGPYLTDALLLAVALGAGLVGAVAAGTAPPIIRAFTPPAELDRTVARRATQAFVDEAVFDTRDRTGILLFVSLVEHRIEVRADEGIDRAVDETAWTDVTDRIRRGIEADRVTQGLLAGIERCGTFLEEAAPPARPDDKDELPDRLRHDE
ncbi:MAG: TPM domain-containing protein [Salinibacter sp.]